MTRPDLDAILPPVSAEDEATVDALLAKAREGVGKRPIGSRPDLDAIRAKWRQRNVVSGNDVPTLLRHIDTLEHMLAEERENVDTLRAAVEHAEQRFVDEYDAHQETRTLLTNLYMKQLRADAAQMREYGISYDGVRKLIAECVADEMNVGKVVELLRAAAHELAKEEIAELKARITTLEAMR